MRNDMTKILTLSNAGALVVAFCSATQGFAAVDRSFKPGTGIAGGDEEGVHVVLPLRDGKILLGGDFGTYNGVSRPDLALVHPNGSLDESVQLPGGVDGDEEPAVWSAGFQPDGKIIVSGNFTTISGIARQGLARLHPNGRLDTAWIPEVTRALGRAIVLADGRVLAWNFRAIELLNADGSANMSFNLAFGDSFLAPQAVSLQADGRILLVATVMRENRPTGQKFLRLHADGSVDTDFVAPAFGPGSTTVNGIAGAKQMPDGRILVFGGFATVDGRSRPGLAIVHSDGRLDIFARFTGPGGYVMRALPLSDGSIVAYSERVEPLPGALAVTVLTEPPRGQRLKGRPWSVEFTFSPNGYVYDMAEDTRGRILIGGEFWELNGVRVPTGIARFVRRGQRWPSPGPYNPMHRVGVPRPRN